MVGNDAGVVHFSHEAGEKPFVVPLPVSNSTEAKTVRERVLVVDDEKMVADTTAEILDAAGFDVETAYNGQRALEIAARFRPDCLLTDVLMSGMNGVELAIALTKLLPAIRIVLFSGQAGISEIVLQGHNQGYDFELVAKPIHPMKLIKHLKDQEG